MIGTVIGAALGTVLGPWIGDRPWLFMPALGAIGAVTVYQATASFAALRGAEVTVGTFACLLISTVFHVGSKWHARRALASGSELPRSAAEPETPVASLLAAPPAAPSPRHARMLLGLQGGLAIVMLAALTYVLHLPGLAQAMVTTIAVLILPVGLASDRTRQPVMDKMVQRVVGCLLAGVLGVALLPLMHGEAVLSMLALSVGVWIGCHVQTGREGASYVGRQFTIAFIMVFVQDHHWSADPVPALMRLSGILTGIVVLTIVMLAVDRLASVRAVQDVNLEDPHA